MEEFSVYTPTRILFGDNQESSFIEAVVQQGRTLLVVTGGGSVKKLGYLARVSEALSAAGCVVHEFSGIEPNPLAKTINRAAKENRSKHVEAVVALGGGSVMDASKAIAALLFCGTDDVWSFVKGSAKEGEFMGSLPIVAIPTTAATASEVTPYAVISNDSPMGKSVLAHEFFKPKVAWLNPSFTTKLPKTTTADGAADILSHVLENYLLGGNGSPLADRYTEAVMMTVLETLPKVLQDPENESHRGSLLWASTMALNGYQLAGREPSEFVLHSIEHAMSAFHHPLAHGRGLATLFPAYFRWLWNAGRAKERLARLGTQLFGLQEEANTGLHFIERFERWLAENSLLQSAQQIGIPSQDYARIARYAVEIYGTEGQLNALGPMTVENIQEVLELTASQATGA